MRKIHPRRPPGLGELVLKVVEKLAECEIFISVRNLPTIGARGVVAVAAVVVIFHWMT